MSKPQLKPVDRNAVDSIVRSWPKVSREAAATMMEKYGPPHEASAGRLIWHNNGPWRRTARCEGESANFLALDLAHEIVQGKKDVEAARRAYGEAMKAKKDNQTPEIIQKLTFEVSRDYTENWIRRSFETARLSP
jgi:hypothetical protein